MDIEEQKILLRPAKPDFAEGLQFAHFLDQAGEGFFKMMLGNESENIVATAYIDTGHALSYENVIFAEIESKIVGMSSTFTEKQHRKFSDEPLRRAAKRRAFRLLVMQILFAPLWRILETIPEGDFYVQAIAIDPTFRGVGIGSFLMNDIEKRARECGANRLSLDVSAKNNGARKLYKRLGMDETSVWPNTRILPTVLIRMSKCL